MKNRHVLEATCIMNPKNIHVYSNLGHLVAHISSERRKKKKIYEKKKKKMRHKKTSESEMSIYMQTLNITIYRYVNVPG